ncbi:MAG: DUF5655 domain-containing protein [Chloroflexota bacterium]|nr:DUF5655 domain-containing protein [Chloroflexota bacterium]
MDDESLLATYFERTTPAAAAAGRAIMAFILELDPQIAWKLNKTTIEFRAERYFCALWPVKRHITFWIFNNGGLKDPQERLQGKGRASYVKLCSLADVDEVLRDLVAQAFRTKGLRPLKRPRRPPVPKPLAWRLCHVAATPM